MNKDHLIGFGIGFLGGAVIGGVIALLFAPKSGKETRRMIMDKTGEIVDVVKDKTEKVVDTVKEKASGVIDVFKESASEVNRKGQAAVKAIKD